ncbi:DgyrCDS3152 [Dimorphilus gyrociliatus]|uniref:protein-tyrosine-phosphatase n=1 Tax=Dimorphilus gyrociliatus TaxID=2664684 RepID=A0A7I8VE37_9ANNE|nr:DgyrCDS3152 [Dimorphilus gyrociliatus]
MSSRLGQYPVQYAKNGQNNEEFCLNAKLGPCCDIDNMALNGNAKQYQGTHKTQFAGRAVDGNFSQHAHTKSTDKYGRIRIELSYNAIISRILILNQQKERSKRLSYLKVFTVQNSTSVADDLTEHTNYIPVGDIDYVIKNKSFAEIYTNNVISKISKYIAIERYQKVADPSQKDGGELIIAEVIVEGFRPYNSIAANKPTQVVSNDDTISKIPVTHPLFQCSESLTEFGEIWRVDLQNYYKIHHLAIFNGNKYSLGSFDIFIHDDSANLPNIWQTNAYQNDYTFRNSKTIPKGGIFSHYFDCKVKRNNVIGRFITLNSKTQVFQFCNLVIKGEKVEKSCNCVDNYKCYNTNTMNHNICICWKNCEDNIAINGKAYRNGIADKIANEAIKDTINCSKSYTSTGNRTHLGIWYLDLKNVYEISTIQIISIPESGGRLRNFDISLVPYDYRIEDANNIQFLRLKTIYNFTGSMMDSSAFTVNVPFSRNNTRGIVIRKRDNTCYLNTRCNDGSLDLCQVYVKGKGIYCNDNEFGIPPKCTQCPLHCNKNYNYSAENLEYCQCKIGYEISNGKCVFIGLLERKLDNVIFDKGNNTVHINLGNFLSNPKIKTKAFAGYEISLGNDTLIFENVIIYDTSLSVDKFIRHKNETKILSVEVRVRNELEDCSVSLGKSSESSVEIPPCSRRSKLADWFEKPRSRGHNCNKYLGVQVSFVVVSSKVENRKSEVNEMIIEDITKNFTEMFLNINVSGYFTVEALNEHYSSEQVKSPNINLERPETSSIENENIGNEPSKIELYAGCGAGGFFIICFIFALLFIRYQRKKKLKEKGNKSDGNTHSPKPSSEKIYYNVIEPFVIESFINELKDKLRKEELIEEHGKLPKNLQEDIPHIVGSSPENKKYLKYINILPYDDNRVELVVTKDEETDFYNASFLKDNIGYNKFIAAQGPTDSSVEHFWRLIWDNNCETIVMLTNLVENAVKKTTAYWPKALPGMDADTLVFAKISVKLEQEQQYADFVVRHFTVTKGEESRKIKQYHYQEWMDHSSLNSPSSLLFFMKIVDLNTSSSTAPVVVHCSAGVGRTGTYIAISKLAEKVLKGERIDVFEVVRKMRRERVNMVQTAEQYTFIYKAVVELYCTSGTFIDNAEFHTKYEHLKVQSETLRKEFKLLNSLNFTIQSSYDDVTTDEKNLVKNRDKALLPASAYRVYLTDTEENYINAVYINSFETKIAFISTQHPLQNTENDFWNMVFKERSSTIVALNDITSDMKPYWPKNEEEEHKLNEFVIILASKKNIAENIVQREISIRKGNETRTIKQYQLKTWSLDIQEKATSLLTLVSLVENWNRSSERESGNTIIVHCKNGVDRTGVFCTAYCLIERMKLLSEVALFSTVKYLRNYRREFIRNQVLTRSKKSVNKTIITVSTVEERHEILLDEHWPQKKESAISLMVQKYNEICRNELKKSKLSTGKYCACVPKTALKRAYLDYNVQFQNWSAIHNIHEKKLGILYGGEWIPNNCVSFQRVAIIIPYRARDSHLKILVHHLHKILTGQQIHYRIFIAEQISPRDFNKGALMNAGYLEMQKLFQFDCVIFHDVDMLMEDGRHMYNCIKTPRHIGPYVNKFHYINRWLAHVGGVFAISKSHFEHLNGYNTLFYGWGDEDDDMQKRIVASRMRITRFKHPLSAFTMLKHKSDKTNPVNPFRKSILDFYTPSRGYSKKIGLTTTHYSLQNILFEISYTLFQVNLEIAAHQLFTQFNGYCNEATPILTLSNLTSLEDCSLQCYHDALCTSFTYLESVCNTYHETCTEDSISPEVFYYRKEAAYPLHQYFTEEEGECLSRNVFKNSAYTLYDCAKLCLRTKVCKSFSYNPKSQRPCLGKLTPCSKRRKNKNCKVYIKKKLNCVVDEKFKEKCFTSNPKVNKSTPLPKSEVKVKN